MMREGRPQESTPLETAIRETLGKRSVSFKEFMELALYHPQWGYYSQGRRPPGRSADFFTSVSVGSCFGELLAVYIHQAWQEKGSPESFTLLEQGGHIGTLAADILQVLSANFPAFYGRLHYWAVERSAAAMTDSRLREHEGRWRLAAGLGEIELGSVDLAFSNELLDAFPVHRVTWEGEGTGWLEHFVEAPDDLVSPLRTVLGELSSTALAESLAAIDTNGFAPGYTTEVNLEIIPWLGSMAPLLAPSGKLLVIDYGMPGESYHAAGRRGGTLQAYRDHRRVDEILAFPGEQDLTAQVNFTHLGEEAAKLGLAVTLFEEQQRFLTSLAREPLLAMERRLAGFAPDVAAAKWIRQFQQLASMGPTFKVMELTNGVGSA